MGIEVKEGRDFRPEDDQKETGCYIFNEKAKAQLELKLNEQIDGDEIIDFIRISSLPLSVRRSLRWLSIFGGNINGDRKAIIIMPPM